MNRKITFRKAVVLGLISTTFATSNIEISTLKSNSSSRLPLKVEIGKSANAVNCNSRCAKRLGRLGIKVGRTIWRRRTQQEEHRK
ncbi:MAG: hypothetical protein AAGE84_01925 [Cyanobacteria bacterium P01_G01_bin.39]